MTLDSFTHIFLKAFGTYLYVPYQDLLVLLVPSVNRSNHGQNFAFELLLSNWNEIKAPPYLSQEEQLLQQITLLPCLLIVEHGGFFWYFHKSEEYRECLDG